MRIIYIYLLSDKGYEKYIFSVNYAEQESVSVHLQDNIAEMYVLCPEYTNVEALTKSYALSAEEHSLYVVDEEGNRDEVGGNQRNSIPGKNPSPSYSPAGSNGVCSYSCGILLPDRYRASFYVAGQRYGQGCRHRRGKELTYTVLLPQIFKQ